MALELSNITFTDEDDIVPASGIDEILNTGVTNTLAGNDKIIGTKEVNANTPVQNFFASIFNSGTLNTGEGEDTIMGTLIESQVEPALISPSNIYNIGSIYTEDGNDIISGIGGATSLVNAGMINTGDGNDTITGFRDRSTSTFGGGIGIYSVGGIGIDSGEGNDIITGISLSGITQMEKGIIIESSSINTSDGNDTIIGNATGSGIYVSDLGNLDTGKGKDIITGTGNYGIENYSFFDTGDGNDIITAEGFNGGIVNNKFMDTGAGKDVITGTAAAGYGIYNYSGGILDSGEGNDLITARGPLSLFNEGIINTGNGADSIIASGDLFEGMELSSGGIYNAGIINTGNGNDSIIATGGFYSNLNNDGIMFLGKGQDYIEGFGRGEFFGEDGNDTLKLTSGSYTVGIIAGTDGKEVTFTQGSRLMFTSGFEELIAGSTIYDFPSLTGDQIIIVA